MNTFLCAILLGGGGVSGGAATRLSSGLRAAGMRSGSVVRGDHLRICFIHPCNPLCVRTRNAPCAPPPSSDFQTFVVFFYPRASQRALTYSDVTEGG